MLKLSIVIVTYNSAGHIADCLDSIYKDEFTDREIIVVDNQSSDHSASIVRNGYDRVVVIENGHNDGFAKGCNIGLQKAVGEFILFLNPDTLLSKGACRQLIDVMESGENIGVIGPRINSDISGSYYHSARRFSSPPKDLISYIPGSRYLTRPHEIMMSIRKKPVDVDWVSGCAFMVSRALLQKTGTFDESYFLFSEEEDLCRRAKTAGWRVVYHPQAVVTHFEGKSFAGGSYRTRMYWTSKLHYYEKFSKVSEVFRFKKYFVPLIRFKMMFCSNVQKEVYCEIIRIMQSDRHTRAQASTL